MVTAIIVDNVKHKALTVSFFSMNMKVDFVYVYWERLLQTLTEKDFPQPLERWVKSFLSEGTACLAFDSQTEAMSPMRTSVSQKSPISAIHLLLYLLPLFDALKTRWPDTSCTSNIDDIGLHVTGKTKAQDKR